MKVFKTFLLLIMIIALLIGCSSGTGSDDAPMVENNAVGPEPPDELVSFKDGETDRKIAINPNRPYYDVVVMDIDRWELCMNLHRTRQHCNSYTGHLWYQSGSFRFEGTLSAVYNHSLDMLAVTALDSGWDRGHILYSMQFTEGTNDLYGSFVYFEFPRRTNGIHAWLVQGQMGPHIYGVQPSSMPETAPPPTMVHPKRARLETEYGE